MPDLDRDAEVFVLDLGADENRFDPEWLAAVNALLDEVVGMEGPRALVTRATGKFWSNGLDLTWMGEHAEQAGPFIEQVHALLARMLSLPVPAVAACQGHVFAAGAMLALAHDARVMRVDRGFFCLPEVDIGLPFTPGMGALIQARLAPQTAHEAMTTGRRYGGLDAAAAGIVDEAVSEDLVQEAALNRVRPLAVRAGPTLGSIKEQMYARPLELLRPR